MTMTKKHFTAMAIKFADINLTILHSDNSAMDKAQQLMATKKAIQGYCEVAKSFNSNFDVDYFVNFIDEIFMGKRDRNGKLRTKAKLEDFLTHSELSEALIAQRKEKA